MTEKELLYYDDAINHEQYLESYIEFAISNLEDNKLIEFMKKELRNHEMIESKLFSVMEDIINE